MHMSGVEIYHWINNEGHMWILGIEPSSVILGQTQYDKIFNDIPK